MSEPTLCAVGGAPIVGDVRRVLVAASPDPLPMCEVHGRMIEFGSALDQLLGHDHPIVVRVHTLLDELLDGACPDVPEPTQCRWCGLPAHGDCVMAILGT